MSIKAMNWAWSVSMPPSSKLILMALADQADDIGECWPKIRTIATKCCVSDRTVRRALKAFEESGVVLVAPRFTSAGRQTSNSYILRMDSPDKLSAPQSPCHGEGDISVPLGVSQLCQGEGDRAMSPLEPPLEPLIETPLQPHQENVCYPGMLGAAEKSAISTLISSLPQGTAQQVLDELAGSMAIRKIRNPASYVYGLTQRVLSGQFVPTLGSAVSENRKHSSADNQATGEGRKAWELSKSKWRKQ